MEFLSPRLSYIFVNRTTKYCCHVWTDAPNCYLNMLDKLQKLVRMVVGPTLAASPVSLTHQLNVVSLSLFYRYYIRKSSFELAELEPYRFFHGSSTQHSDRLHDFTSMSPVYFLGWFHYGIIFLWTNLLWYMEWVFIFPVYFSFLVINQSYKKIKT